MIRISVTSSPASVLGHKYVECSGRAILVAGKARRRAVAYRHGRRRNAASGQKGRPESNVFVTQDASIRFVSLELSRHDY